MLDLSFFFFENLKMLDLGCERKVWIISNYIYANLVNDTSIFEIYFHNFIATKHEFLYHIV